MTAIFTASASKYGNKLKASNKKAANNANKGKADCPCPAAITLPAPNINIGTYNGSSNKAKSKPLLWAASTKGRITAPKSNIVGVANNKAIIITHI